MKKHFAKTLSIVSFIFLLLAIYIIAITPPADGYELSIYNVYSRYFWFLIIGSIACGISILIFQEFSHEKANFWPFGFYIMLLANLCIILLPIFRGYVLFGKGDPLTHLGHLRGILLTGYLGKENFYPAIHLLAAIITCITQLDPFTIMKFIPPFFSIFYIISIYLLASSLTKIHSSSLIITAFGSILFFRSEYIIFTPTFQAFFLLPCLLFLYNKIQNSPIFVMLFIIMLISIPFFHPLFSVLMIVILLCFEVGSIVYNRKNNSTNATYGPSGHPIKFISLLFVTLFIWYSSFSSFATNVNTINDWLFYRIGETEYTTKYSNYIEDSPIPFSELIEIFLRTYGQYLLYSILAVTLIVATSIIIRKKALSLASGNYLNLIRYCLLFFVLSMLTFFTLQGHMGFGWGRIVVYPMFAVTILNGLCMANLISNKHFNLATKKILAIVIVIFLIISASVQLFSIYFYPIATGMGNPQVTYQEIDGMNWLLGKRDLGLLIDEVGISQYRFGPALLGIGAVGLKNIRLEAEAPKHFEYENSTEWQRKRYLIFGEYARANYRQLGIEHPKLANSAEFNEIDFNKINFIPNIAKIYSNNEFSISYLY